MKTSSQPRPYLKGCNGNKTPHHLTQRLMRENSQPLFDPNRIQIFSYVRFRRAAGKSDWGQFHHPAGLYALLGEEIHSRSDHM